MIKSGKKFLVGSCMGEEKYGILLVFLNVRDLLKGLDLDRELKFIWITQRYTGLNCFKLEAIGLLI